MTKIIFLQFQITSSLPSSSSCHSQPPQRSLGFHETLFQALQAFKLTPFPKSSQLLPTACFQSLSHLSGICNGAALECLMVPTREACFKFCSFIHPFSLSGMFASNVDYLINTPIHQPFPLGQRPYHIFCVSHGDCHIVFQPSAFLVQLPSSCELLECRTWVLFLAYSFLSKFQQRYPLHESLFCWIWESISTISARFIE